MNTITVNPAIGELVTWNPIRGTCFSSIDAPTDTVRQEAVAVMSRCLPPSTGEGRRTGLVVGYVQSGKTSSFTTVAALARDNGYQLVVVVSGTSKNLYRQSAARVVQSLRDADPNGWIPLYSHDITARNLQQAVQAVSSSLEFWRSDGIAGSARKTVLLCVMKNAQHLSNVLAVLREVDLSGVRALVIDDEADQASLNYAQAPGAESSIYGLLNGIRSALPHVTYLQYTATPQATLLIRLDDALSPEFSKVLTAGASFTGPARFFDTDANRLLRQIPPTDIALARQGTAPRSLQEAMAFYFLGVAAHLLNPDESGTGNRTMMIHPSQQTIGHGEFRTFVEATIARWRQALSAGAAQEECAIVNRLFRVAFDDLRVGVQGVAFDELWPQVHNALKLTVVETMNATERGIRDVNWHLPYHIVIGGMMLDRGYTVEGLTVTYMPRAQTRGTADNIQQRARWFGYKERYIGYCRVWLPQASIDTYSDILEHEEAMRDSLRSHFGPLAQWRRRFFLDPNLQPTRRQVVRLRLVRGVYAGQWFAQKAPHGQDGAVTDRNWALVDTLGDGLSFEPFGRPHWTQYQHGEIARGVPLSRVNEFLQTFACEDETDSARLVGVAMQTAEYERRFPQTQCAVVRMSSRDGQWTARDRDVTDRLHMGKSPSYPNDPSAYPGDANQREDVLTIQLFRMRGANGSTRGAPAIAVHVPSEMRRHWIVAEED